METVHGDVGTLGQSIVRQRLAEREGTAPGGVADERDAPGMAELRQRGDVAGDPVIGRRHDDERLGVRIRVEGSGERRRRDAMLHVPCCIDDDRHDHRVQPGCERMRTLGLVDVGGQQDRVARAGDGGKRGVEALRRSAGDEAAEIRLPRLGRDLVRLLQDVGALGAIVEALGRDHVGDEQLAAEQPAQVARDGRALVVTGGTEAVHASAFDGDESVENRGAVLIHTVHNARCVHLCQSFFSGFGSGRSSGRAGPIEVS